MADSGAARYDLGIDTAADAASLALLDAEGNVVAQRAWHATSTMSRELLGQVHALLEGAGVEPAEVARIAVDVGPGQYGALRTGIATAQGLAIALDVPLAGIGRLEAEAYGHLARGVATVVAVHDTRNGAAWGTYELGADGTPRALVAPRIDTAAEAVRLAPTGALWCGEIGDALRALLPAEAVLSAEARDAETQVGDTGDTESDPARGVASRAVALVRIARARDAFGDAAGVDAVYLRPPPITRPAGTTTTNA